MKTGDLVCCQKCSVWYHELSFDAKGKRRFIRGRCLWSEMYHQVIGIVHTELRFRSTVRSFLLFILTKFKTFIKKILTYSSSYTKNVSALILYLANVFKHVFSEIIETVSLYREIIPTRYNNCVYSSQWLYSTCFGWQFHPSSGVQCCIWPFR